jgi:hypothetical protein
MSPTSLFISTGNHMGNRRTPFPFYNTMIPLINDIDSLFIIDIQTAWGRELIDSITFFISSSYSETILLPFGTRMNVNSRCS